MTYNCLIILGANSVHGVSFNEGDGKWSWRVVIALISSSIVLVATMSVLILKKYPNIDTCFCFDCI